MTDEPKQPELTLEYVYGALSAHRAVLRMLTSLFEDFVGEPELIHRELLRELAQADLSGDRRAGAESEIELLRPAREVESDGSDPRH